MDNFLQSLRSRTAHKHSLLEQTAVSKKLLDHEVTTADYATYLSTLYGFLKGFENIIFPLLQHSILDIDQRRKTHLIVSDLNALGIDETKIAVIPDLFFSEVYHSSAEALGGMYVLEGSILGGAVIIKHLQNRLSTEALIGKASYFTAYGAEIGSRWRLFLQTFCLASSSIEEEVTKSAAQTFSILQDWFDNNSYKITQYES